MTSLVKFIVRQELKSRPLSKCSYDKCVTDGETVSFIQIQVRGIVSEIDDYISVVKL